MMIWDCTFFGIGDASWIQEKINSDVYLDVVKDYFRQSHDGVAWRRQHSFSAGQCSSAYCMQGHGVL